MPLNGILKLIRNTMNNCPINFQIGSSMNNVAMLPQEPDIFTPQWFDYHRKHMLVMVKDNGDYIALNAMSRAAFRLGQSRFRMPVFTHGFRVIYKRT